MTEYVKVEKIVPKFPPPAFGDIAKASNDVCLGCLSSFGATRLLTCAGVAYQQGLLSHCRRLEKPIEPRRRALTPL